MKKLFALILALSFLMLTGCARAPEDVKLDTKWQIKHYCQKNFGNCEIISSIKEDNKIVYEIKDKEKGFTYKVTSYATSVEYFDYWTKERLSNFYSCYYETFLDEYKDKILELESTYNIIFNYDNMFLIGTRIEGQTEDELQKAAQKIIEFEKAFDTRDLWGDFTVSMYVDENRVGYVKESRGYISEEQDKIEDLLNRVSREMKVSVDKLTFIRSEISLCESLEGYDSLRYKNYEDEKIEALVCYFEYNNEEYFVADLFYYDGRGSHAFGNYPHR